MLRREVERGSEREREGETVQKCKGPEENKLWGRHTHYLFSITTGNSAFRELHGDERETSKRVESKMCVT